MVVDMTAAIDTAPENPAPMPRVCLPGDSSVGFISDLHLDPRRPDIGARLAAFLAGAGRRFDALCILGDLFEYWVGDDGIDACGYRDYVTALSGAASGIGGLYLMHGNRDFLMAGQLCQELGATLLEDPCILEIGNLPVLLAHGDAYCTDDRDHMAFREQVRQAPWQAQFLSRPLAERVEFARRARAASERGKAEKPALIMDVNTNAVQAAMAAAGVCLMIHGHTHRPGIHRHRVGERDCYRAVLGDWFDQQSSMVLSESRLVTQHGIHRETLDLRLPDRPDSGRGSPSSAR